MVLDIYIMNSTVNIGHQTSLAKLLAKENIQVRTGNFRTAYFDVKNRVLGLPIMKDLDKAAYDLFVGHEVGHALFTPEGAGADLPKNIPFDTLNVIEDIRIERMIQDTYPGLGECFRAGYRQLWNQNFFKTSEADFPKLGRLDRLNIRAKMRGVIDFKLSAEEEAFYQKCYAATTIEQVLELCKEIYETVKQDVEKPQNTKGDSYDGQKMPAPSSKNEEASDESKSDDSSPAVSAEDDSDDSTESDGPSPMPTSSSEDSDKAEDADSTSASGDGEDDGKAAKDSDTKSSASSEAGAGGDSNPDNVESPKTTKSIADELKSLTASAFKEAMNSKVAFEKGVQMIVEPSKKNIESCIVPYAEVSRARRLNSTNPIFMNAPQFIEAKQEFSRKAKTHVSILTREFEMRRKAFQYSRSKESKSGSLNMERLHSYKYSEDIFRSVTLLANSKNHGMVMFIDFSDSMTPNMPAVLEQTIYLALFCRAVSIPFVVYGFTSPGNGYEHHDKISDEMTHDEVYLRDRLHLVEQLSSKMSKNEFLNAVNELYAIAYYSRNGADGANGRAAVIGRYDRLGSTPLLECVIAAHHIVSRFKSSNALQKCSVIFLTDGDGGRISSHHKNYIYSASGAENSFGGYYRISLNGKTLQFRTTVYADQYKALINNLRETIGSSVIGFFICSKHAVKNYLNCWVDNRETRDKLMTQVRKNSYAIASDGIIASYDAMYIIPGITSSNGDFDVELDEDDRNDAGFTSARSVNKIANAFIDTAHEKKRSRVILQSFAEVIS